MPLDNSAAQNAQNLLNGINYEALIGGPLQAAVRAQAMAARSTWEFIQQVGLQKETDGNVSAVNVTFLYQKDGEMVKLIVPILTIVPIPLILVDEVSVQFKANINASASSTTEESESSALAGELEASGRVGWGPFSLEARMKASYSSKKDSKATQDSRYSVEYTQDVSVHASQAGVPAGLATVLNILSNAATGATRHGELRVSPEVLTLDAANPQQVVKIKLIDGDGLNVKTGSVSWTLTDPSGAITPGGGAFGRAAIQSPLSTGPDGSVSFTLRVDGAKLRQAPADDVFPTLKIQASIDNKPTEVDLPIRLVTRGFLPATTGGGTPRTLGVSPASPQIKAAGGSPVNVTITADPGTDVKVTYPTTLTVKDGNNLVASGGSIKATGGNAVFTLDAGTGATAQSTATVTFEATGYQAQTVTVTFS